jgi:prefoldin subunit 5
MNAFLKLLTDLFARARGVGNKMSPKKQNEIIKALEDSIDKVTAGTAKIDEQIAELKAIERQLDKADEIIAPLDNLIGDLSKKTGATPEETKRVLIDKYNEGYPPGDPKRLLPEDDDRLRAYIESQKLMGNEEDLMIDILENAELPLDQMAGIRSLAEVPGTFKDLGKTDVGIPDPRGLSIAEEVDEALKINKQRQKDLARAEELMMDMENFGKSFDEIMQMVQDEKVIPFMKFAPNPRTKKSAGGLAKLFARMGMKAPDKVADVKQTKNIIRDPETDLSRRPDTPREKRTIDELEQMFMDDPRYTGMNAKEMQKLIDKEKIRADVSYNMDIAPEDIPDDMIEMLYQEGYHLNFANGGGVGSLFKRRK